MQSGQTVACPSWHPTLVQQVFNISEGQWEPNVHHHRKPDDFWAALKVFGRITFSHPGKRYKPAPPASSRIPLTLPVHLYNTQLPQSALKARTAALEMKEWFERKPELFKKKPYYLTGCDN
ncbi:MAG: hypothetical protein L3J02_00830 [Henriciella sp.]|nr:hypothetical protein [Henriciella sp.]